MPGGKFIKSKMNNLDVLAHVLAAAQQWGNGWGVGEAWEVWGDAE